MARDLSRAGDHFIVGLSSTALLPEERELLRSLRPLGIILFAKNLRLDQPTWRNDLSSLLDDATQAAGREHLLVSIDHEGGRVHRFPAPVTRFPAARHLGHRAREVATAMGHELRALGFNLSFAPVLDIHSEPKNTVIGDRAFGHDAATVVLRGKETLLGLHDTGVLSCCKHFPGHGDTTQDSHNEMPYLDVERSTLFEREIIPFRELIRFGAPLVMTAHVRYRSLDQDNPASLSKNIISGILREELGYAKAVITDDLEMKALWDFSPAERGVRAAIAGTDILLEANPKTGVALEFACDMAQALLEAGERGEVDLPASRRRVEDLLTFAKNLAAVPPPDAEIVGSSTHLALLQEVTPKLPLA